MAIATKPSRVISVEEAGKMLGLSRGSAYQAAAAGEIPTIRIGRRLLVPRARLEALLGESHEQASADV